MTTFERMHGVPADSVWSDDGSRGTEFDSNRVVGYNERSLNRIDAQLEKDRLEEEARAKRDKTFSDQKERFTERDQSSFIPNSEVTTGFTDSEWRMKVTAWREIEREARAENAKTDEEKRLKAAIMVAADKEAKEAEWWANKEAYDKKRQAEREAAPAKHAAWVREQKVNVATPGTSFYESMNEEEKTLNAAFQQEQTQEAQEREIRRRLEQRQGLKG